MTKVISWGQEVPDWSVVEANGMKCHQYGDKLFPETSTPRELAKALLFIYASTWCFGALSLAHLVKAISLYRDENSIEGAATAMFKQCAAEATLTAGLWWLGWGAITPLMGYACWDPLGFRVRLNQLEELLCSFAPAPKLSETQKIEAIALDKFAEGVGSNNIRLSDMLGMSCLGRIENKKKEE